MLIGEKIILRPIKLEDWVYTHQWRNNLFIKTSTISHPFPITEEMEKQWYEKHLTEKNNSFLPFTVINKVDENIVGYFSLNNINWINRNAFVSGAIGETTNIGKGLGKEAVILLLNYGFNHLNLIKICAYVRSDHPALPLWKKLKAINEGTLEKHIFSDGEYRDVEFISWFNSNF